MWEPVVQDKKLISAISEKIEEIYAIVRSKDFQEINLFEGRGGKVLFETVYADFKNRTPDADEIFKDLDLIYSNTNSLKTLNLFVGLAGILYLRDYLSQNDYIEFGTEEEIDLFEFYKDKPLSEDADLDFLHGMSGVILQELENKGKLNDDLINKWLEAIQLKNEDNSVNELRWKVDSEQHSGEVKQVYSFGLSHGTPFLIILLIKLWERRGKETEKKLADNAVNFLLNSRLEKGNEFYFPNQIVDGEKTMGRLAWCYGDLGCAFALFKYGRAINSSYHTSLAETVFNSHLHKRDLEKYSVLDADFCHGSVGIAHIYARMYNLTRREPYRECSEYWYKKTMELATHKNGLAGFKHFTGKKGYENRYGLLEGVIGIGSSLISAVSNNEPKWDSCFLLS